MSSTLEHAEDTARAVLELVGGAANVRSVTHCATRLRFVLADASRADLTALAQVDGVLTAMNAGGQTQVVVGQRVPEVYEALIGLNGVHAEAGGGAGISASPGAGADVTAPEGGAGADADPGAQQPRGPAAVVDVIASIFTPIIVAMAGAGMLKGLCILATTLNWLSEDTGTYRILYAASDGIFQFLPMFLAYTSAKKFNATPFVSMAIAAALLYPDMVAAYEGDAALTFLGVPVTLVAYRSSVLPIILAVYGQSWLERWLRRIIPVSIRNIIIPLVTLIVVVPLTYLVIGPVATAVGNGLASGYQWLVSLSPVVAGLLLGGIWPLAVMFGVHYGFVPIVFQNLGLYGRDTLFTITGPNNMAQAGAAFGVFLKTRQRGLKGIAGSSSLSAVLAGVTEPAIYGVNLKYRRPFVIGAIFSGIAGAIVAASGAGASALVSTSLLTMPAYVGAGFGGFVVACAIAFFGAAITTYLIGFSDSMVTASSDPGGRGSGEEVR